jgi:AcrR family transcriptional regulator
MTMMNDPEPDPADSSTAHRSSADSSTAHRSSTRQRVTDAAMRLFGAHGYAATTVAQIEAEAGLRSGSGGLYRHFSSKREVLETGVREQLASARSLEQFIEDPQMLSEASLRDRLRAVARAGLARLEEERDLNRIVLRDLRDFPELAQVVSENEMRRIQSVLAAWLRAQGGSVAGDNRSDIDREIDREIDWDAIAAVLMGAVSHYWILRDSMREHPSGVSQDAYLDALVDLVVARLEAC